VFVVYQTDSRRGLGVTPEEMRAKALECEGMVRMYTELAHQWRELADQIERNKRPP
jgi:hypothetical protein